MFLFEFFSLLLFLVLAAITSIIHVSCNDFLYWTDDCMTGRLLLLLLLFLPGSLMSRLVRSLGKYKKGGTKAFITRA